MTKILFVSLSAIVLAVLPSLALTQSNLISEEFGKIRPGISTREDVALILGETVDDGSRLVYESGNLFAAIDYETRVCGSGAVPWAAPKGVVTGVRYIFEMPTVRLESVIPDPTKFNRMEDPRNPSIVSLFNSDYTISVEFLKDSRWVVEIYLSLSQYQMDDYGCLGYGTTIEPTICTANVKKQIPDEKSWVSIRPKKMDLSFLKSRFRSIIPKYTTRSEVESTYGKGDIWDSETTKFYLVDDNVVTVDYSTGDCRCDDWGGLDDGNWLADSVRWEGIENVSLTMDDLFENPASLNFVTSKSKRSFDILTFERHGFNIELQLHDNRISAINISRKEFFPPLYNCK